MAYAHHCNDPDETLRLIDKLEADRRRVERARARCLPGTAYARELAEQRADLDVQLAHWRSVVARAQERGFRVWSRDDFAPGDFVRYLDTWYEVLRVNRRSLTIPHLRSGTGRGVVRAADVRPGWTWTLDYHAGIGGRMSAEEMARHPADDQRPGDHSG